MIFKNSVKNCLLKIRNLSEESKNPPEQKYSVAFLSKNRNLSRAKKTIPCTNIPNIPN